MGQFSVKIYTSPGSLLNANQQMVNLRTGTLVFVIVSDRNLTQTVRPTQNIKILKNRDFS